MAYYELAKEIFNTEKEAIEEVEQHIDRSLEEIIYFASYVVLEPGNTPLEKKQLLSEREYRDKKQEYGNGFTAEMGAEAIKKLLRDVDRSRNWLLLCC